MTIFTLNDPSFWIPFTISFTSSLLREKPFVYNYLVLMLLAKVRGLWFLVCPCVLKLYFSCLLSLPLIFGLLAFALSFLLSPFSYFFLDLWTLMIYFCSYVHSKRVLCSLSWVHFTLHFSLILFYSLVLWNLSFGIWPLAFGLWHFSLGICPLAFILVPFFGTELFLCPYKRCSIKKDFLCNLSFVLCPWSFVLDTSVFGICVLMSCKGPFIQRLLNLVHNGGDP